MQNYSSFPPVFFSHIARHRRQIACIQVNLSLLCPHDLDLEPHPPFHLALVLEWMVPIFAIFVYYEVVK